MTETVYWIWCDLDSDWMVEDEDVKKWRLAVTNEAGQFYFVREEFADSANRFKDCPTIKHIMYPPTEGDAKEIKEAGYFFQEGYMISDGEKSEFLTKEEFQKLVKEKKIVLVEQARLPEEGC